MSIEIHWAPPGAATVTHLAATLAAQRAGDPLAAATVVVPTNATGVMMRRSLGGRPGGVANVSFLTLDQLALELAGPRLEASGARRLTDQILAALIRQQLQVASGAFAAVRHHPSTDRSLTEALAFLRRGSIAPEQLIDRPGLAGSVGQLLAAIEAVMAGDGGPRQFYDEQDLWREAASLLRAAAPQGSGAGSSGSGSGQPGSGQPGSGQPGLAGSAQPVVLVHPGALTPGQHDVLAALALGRSLTVLLAATGDSVVDQHAAQRCRQWWSAHGSAPDVPEPPVLDPPQPTQVRLVADPDDEVRHVLRWVLAQRAAGVPAERIGVFYTATQPYRRALARQCAVAGIETNGPATTTVGETVAGRIIRTLLSLDPDDLPRDEVMALLASGPVRSPGGGAVRPVIWEQLTRRAGVVRGVDQWRDRLAALDQLVATDPRVSDHRRSTDRAFIADILTFITTLHADLKQGETIDSWSQAAAWVRGLLLRYLGPPSLRSAWPEDEQQAAERFDLALELLGALDGVEPEPTRVSMIAAVELELERATRRHGRLGRGVLVAPLSVGAGADLDAIAVVGLVEGSAPVKEAFSPLIGDPSSLGVDTGRSATDQHRQFLAVLAAAPADRRLVTVPRGDARSGRTVFVSRWLEGHPLDDIPTLLGRTSSCPEPPATRDEVHLRSLNLDDPWGDRSNPLWADPAVAVSARLSTARRFGGFGPATGQIDPAVGRSLLERELSATMLETYAACPYRVLLKSVLGLQAFERPEEIEGLSPLTRGDTVHRVAEQFVAERIAAEAAAGSPLPVDQPAERRRLLQLLDAACQELEASGQTGRPVMWERDQQSLRALTLAFHDLDVQARADGRVAVQTELQFGTDHPLGPVELDVPGVGPIRFKGAADRVERDDSGVAYVIDYKTTTSLKRVPDVRLGAYQGSRLQLPLYTLAVGAAHAVAEYWYLALDGSTSVARVNLDDVRHWFHEVVGVFAAGISGGSFPARPGPPDSFPRHTFQNCRWCDFDRVCGTDRAEVWDRVSGDAELTQYVAITSRELADGPTSADGPAAATSDPASADGAAAVDGAAGGAS